MCVECVCVHVKCECVRAKCVCVCVHVKSVCKVCVYVFQMRMMMMKTHTSRLLSCLRPQVKSLLFFYKYLVNKGKLGIRDNHSTANSWKIRTEKFHESSTNLRQNIATCVI